jgi:hypothetical protein
MELRSPRQLLGRIVVCPSAFKSFVYKDCKPESRSPVAAKEEENSSKAKEANLVEPT